MTFSALAPNQFPSFSDYNKELLNLLYDKMGAPSGIVYTYLNSSEVNFDQREQLSASFEFANSQSDMHSSLEEGYRKLMSYVEKNPDKFTCIISKDASVKTLRTFMLSNESFLSIERLPIDVTLTTLFIRRDLPEKDLAMQHVLMRWGSPTSPSPAVSDVSLTNYPYLYPSQQKLTLVAKDLDTMTELEQAEKQSSSPSEKV